jgi:carbon storage regulator
MLVLSRKVGEEIVIGDVIRIKVVEIRGGKVRIGIAAPENVVVDRQEIHEKRLSNAHEWSDHEVYQSVSSSVFP